MKKFLLTLVAAGMTLAAAAHKQLYIPAEWQNPRTPPPPPLAGGERPLSPPNFPPEKIKKK